MAFSVCARLVPVYTADILDNMDDSLDKVLKYRVSPLGALIIVIAMILLAVIAEIAFVPANVVVPIVYPAAVAACLWTRSVRVLWMTAFIAMLLALFIQRFSFRPPLVDMGMVVWINRWAAVATILFVALFVDRGIRTHLFAETTMFSLEEKNGVLAGLNLNLGLREEEIVRQNEELQSQTEELERQTEELRVTNEELASWERRLEQLLELSRNLTADTSRGDVFSQICEALSSLVETHATTLLIRSGDDLEIQCHHGFGPDGPRVKTLPYTSSFASQVMQLGQTGYLDDIRLRPDLLIPQPKNGPEFHAVLATPLRIDGRTIGTIEAYGAENRAWNSAEVAIIESLAVQAGKSIQEAELMEAVQHERRRFEAALRTVPVGMAVSDDATGQKIRMNGAAAAIFELPSDENISLTTPVGGRLANRFVQLNRLNKVNDPQDLPLWRALRGEEVYGTEFEFRTNQGKRMSLLVSAAPIQNDQLEVIGAVTAFVDITGHKALERELDLRRREAEEASFRKTRFLAAISHDIRTPANAVNIMAEIIRRMSTDQSRAAEIAEMAERLQANIHVLMELIGDLLDIARFDTGKMELSMSEFALADLIKQEVEQVLPLVRDKGLELIVEPLARPVWLRSDRVKLGRVLGNLLGNAIKFTQNGVIRVTARIGHEGGRRLVLRVEDTGIGISPENLEWIFDEFAQVQNPARDRSKGAGLGLAICKRIVELLDGTIRVERIVGQGSAFIVELPPSALVMRTDIVPTPVPEKRELNLPPVQINLRILLIEDHSPTRDGTSRILREEGAEVVEAPDGRTALDLLRQQSFDIILLDMMLPDIDGREILRAFQDERPSGLRGILVLTGDLTQERLHEIKALGGDGLIGKPIELPKLLQILRSFQRAV